MSNLKELVETVRYWFDVNLRDGINKRVNYVRNCIMFAPELINWNWWDHEYHTAMFVKMISIAEQHMYLHGNEVKESRYQKCYQMRRLVKLIQDLDEYENALYDIIQHKKESDYKFASGVTFPGEQDVLNDGIYIVYRTKYSQLIFDCISNENYGYNSWWD